MDKKNTATTREAKRTKQTGEGTSKMRPRNEGSAKTGSTQSHSGQQHPRRSGDASMEKVERKENKNQSPSERDDEDNDEQ